MGNSKSKLESVYKSKLKELNELVSEQKENNNNNNILQYQPSDIFAIILSYSHRPEQIHLINLLFPHSIQQYQKELPLILEHLITVPYADPKLINSFNEKYHQNVLENQNVNPNKDICIFFNNITLIASNENLSYLQSGSNNVLHSFIFYLIRKEDIFTKKKPIQSLSCDPFIDGFKKNLKTMKVDKEIEHKFRVDDSKLENIEYKNEYAFRQFNRIQNNEKFNGLSWKQFNTIYMNNVLNNMLNYCGDKMKVDNFKNINYGNDDLESLNILLAPQLFYELNGFGIFNTKSKNVSFVREEYIRATHRKTTKTRVTTKKYAHICYFDWTQNNLSVLSMFNKESSQHVKDDKNIAKKVADAYVNDVLYH